jgi:ketosteroid isomerase-like protein
MIITPEYADAFFTAVASRDPALIAPFVADDAEWLIVGPLELFPFCGQHLGKEAVLAAYQRVRERRWNLTSVREFLIADGQSASSLTRFTGTLPLIGRHINVRAAQFARFHDRKVVEFCSIIDTLGVAEQVLGRALLPVAAAPAPALVG